MTKKAPPGAWNPGQSGNPAGRPRGAGQAAKLRDAIGQHVPEMLEKLVALAKDGDVQASRLLLERVLPPIKPIEQAAPLALPNDGTLTDQGRAVLNAVGAGELAPAQGAQLLSGIATLARVIEIDELERRIATLEEGNRTADAGTERKKP